MISKKALFTCLLMVGLLSKSVAQNIKSLTIDEAVKMALQNSDEIKNLVIDEEIQAAKNKELEGTARPQISGSGQISYYFATPQVQFPNTNFGIYQVLQKEGIKDGSGNPIDVSKATVSTQAVSFFAPLNMQFGAGVQQLLFQPDVFVALQARERVMEFTKSNTEVAKEKVKEAVRKSYYNVLVAESQKNVLIETISRLEKLYGDMEQMYKAGFAEKLDIDKIQVTINNTKSGLNLVNNGMKISLAVLKNTLGVSQSDSINLSEKLDIQDLKVDLLFTEEKFNYENRKEILLLNSVKGLQELDIRRNELSKYPTVAAFLNYNRSGQRNTKFSPDDPWFWFGTGIVGLNVSVPIYDGGQRKSKLQQAKLNLQKTDNSLSNVKKLIDMEQSIARSTLSNAIINIETQERNRALAEDVFNTARKKYESGLGSSFELIQADSELQRSIGSYFQALYDGFIAKTSFLKSLGRL
jgi:outer membrane protein TolC